MKSVITGGIACGKSLAGEILERSGWLVIDTDHIAHKVMAPGTSAHAAIVEWQGRGVLRPDGSINRVALGEKVFGDDEVRLKLNEIVHPYVRKLVSELCEKNVDRNVMVIIPLLYESGFGDMKWDQTICIYSTKQKQIERLLGRGLDEAGARLRIASQLPTAEKARRSDCVIINNSSLVSVERQLKRMSDEISGV